VQSGLKLPIAVFVPFVKLRPGCRGTAIDPINWYRMLKDPIRMIAINLIAEVDSFCWSLPSSQNRIWLVDKRMSSTTRQNIDKTQRQKDEDTCNAKTLTKISTRHLNQENERVCSAPKIAKS
jgi:hypothetical protein